MRKTLTSLLIGLTLSIGLAPVSHAGGDKLVGAEEGIDNKRLATDVSGNTLAIGASGEGYVKIYVNANGNWKEQWQLQAQERVEKEEARIPAFGWSVSLTGVHEIASANYAIVGAPTDTHPEKGEVVNEGGGIAGIFAAGEKGAAYIFRRTGNEWRQQVKLVAEEPTDDDRYGESVAIFRTTAIIGVSKDDDNNKNEGSAYIYVREGTDWRQQAKIVPEDLGGSDAFGAAVDIRESTAVIGAPGHTPGGVRFAGAAYIYVREGETWRQQAKLTANDGAKADRFGSSVAIGSGTIVIGAPAHDTDKGKDSGAAYVYVRDGDRWKLEAKLTPEVGEKSDQFGFGVDTNGNIVIIGAKGRSERALAAGAAYSFVRTDGRWEEKKKVLPDDLEQKINFGGSVAINGNTVVVASHNAGNDGPGFGHGTAVHVFSSIKDFDTPPFSVNPTGLRITSLGKVKRTALFQNFPNPFNPETWLPYRLASDSPVSFRIYNAQGQLMRELDLGLQTAADYLTRETAAYWDGRNRFGETVSSGVYFYTLEAGSYEATRRMLVLK